MISGISLQHNYSLVSEEAEVYNDVVVFNFIDSYKNLTIKTLVSINWIYKTYNASIYLKIDSDFLYNVNILYKTIKETMDTHVKVAEHLIVGQCFSHGPVIRDLNSRYGMSREVYAPDEYPRYCSGGSYAMSRSTIPALLKWTPDTPLLRFEDVSIGLLASRVKEILMVHIHNWMNFWNGGAIKLEMFTMYHAVHILETPDFSLEQFFRDLPISLYPHFEHTTVDFTFSKAKYSPTLTDIFTRVANGVLKGKIENLNRQIKNLTPSSCKRRNNIAYIKTFKTGSSTFTNILNR